jgi:hypothetical protein
MKQSTSSEADSHSANQEIPLHFMEPEGSLPCSQQPCVRWIQYTHSHPISLRSILMLSSHLWLSITRGYKEICGYKIAFWVTFPVEEITVSELHTQDGSGEMGDDT